MLPFTNLVFQEAPENFTPKVEVAACFILVGNQVLFLKRLPHKTEGDTWGIPGGKCEKEETALAAMVREIREETTIDLNSRSIKSHGKVYIRYPKVDFIYHMFECSFSEFPDVVIDTQEHSEYRWMTLQDALKLPLIPGEDECIYLCYGKE
jgi:8-oxo-dGTP pyrophosphatase MutT (NUDIX family)